MEWKEKHIEIGFWVLVSLLQGDDITSLQTAALGYRSASSCILTTHNQIEFSI